MEFKNSDTDAIRYNVRCAKLSHDKPIFSIVWVLKTYAIIHLLHLASNIIIPYALKVNYF